MDSMRKMLLIMIILVLSSGCTSNSVSLDTSSSTAASTSAATSQGCTASQIAVRIKNSVGSGCATNFSINTNSTCTGTDYPAGGVFASNGITSLYSCAPSGTYYPHSLGTSNGCNATSFTYAANKVYTVTVTACGTGTITATSAQD